MLFNVPSLLLQIMVPFMPQLFLLLFNLRCLLLLTASWCLATTSPVSDATSRDRVGLTVTQYNTAHNNTSNWSSYSNSSNHASQLPYGQTYGGSSSQSSNYNGQWTSLTGDDSAVTTTASVTMTPEYADPTLMDNLMYRPSALVPEINLNSGGVPDCLSSATDTYCESVSEYPSINLRKEIKMTPGEFREMFGQSIMDGRKSYADDESSDEERICRRIPRIVYPKMARNLANNQWLFIVNDAEYTQPVIIEQCENQDRSCSYLEDHLAPGMYSFCRQKYAYRKLLALHPTEPRAYTDTFRFPSCCACHVKVPLGFSFIARSRSVSSPASFSSSSSTSSPLSSLASPSALSSVISPPKKDLLQSHSID